jgi:hypothetical protein
MEMASKQQPHCDEIDSCFNSSLFFNDSPRSKLRGIVPGKIKEAQEYLAQLEEYGGEYL